MDRNDGPRTQTDLLPVARQAALPGFSRGGIYHIGTLINLEEVRRRIIAGLGIAPLPSHVVREDVERVKLWRLPPYEAPLAGA